MNWKKGFSASFSMNFVDPVTWRDLKTTDFTTGTISRSTDDLMQSADFDMTESPGEKWVRVYVTTLQAGGGAHVALFTGLTSAPQEVMDGIRKHYSVECYSTLKPAADVLLPRGYFAAEGVDGARLAAELLRVGPAPVTYKINGPKLKEAIVAEDDETNFSMARRLIDAIGWMIRIGGDGSISIEPYPEAVSAKYDAFEDDAVEPQVTNTYDWYSCPNCFRAISGDLVEEVKDMNPNNSLSIPSRGREIWQQETSVTLGDGENLYDYARRRLAELQSPGRTINYTRRYNPDILPGDLVRLHYPKNGITGVYRSRSQTITIGHGCRTEEEATYERA
jgi:hypothetical protein